MKKIVNLSHAELDKIYGVAENPDSRLFSLLFEDFINPVEKIDEIRKDEKK